MKKRKLELKKEVIASLNNQAMTQIVGGDVLGPTHLPSECVCMVSEKSPCHTIGYDCLKFTEFPCKITDACDTLQDCQEIKITVYPCKVTDVCNTSEIC